VVPVRKALLIPMLLACFLLGGGFAFRSEAPAATKAVSGTLHAKVGPGFEISLTFDDGTPVTNLPAGEYTVAVRDLAEQHNFHLFGPGVEQKTEIATQSEATWTVTFQDQNAYSFQCDAHSSLTGNFTVGNLPAPAPVTTHAPDPLPLPPAPAPLPLRGQLQATLAAKTIALAKGKAAVRKLPRGIYVFSISDSTKLDSFDIRQVVGGSFAQQLTTTGFVGRKTVTVELQPGKWKVYSARREQALYAFFDVT
jgi:hypothetical protein